MYVNQTLFFQLGSVVLSWKTWILITCLGNECTVVTKRWLPNTNFNNSANWDKGRVPCVGDNVQLNQVNQSLAVVSFFGKTWTSFESSCIITLVSTSHPFSLHPSWSHVNWPTPPFATPPSAPFFSVLNSVCFPLLPSTLLHTQDVSSMNTQF